MCLYWLCSLQTFLFSFLSHVLSLSYLGFVVSLGPTPLAHNLGPWAIILGCIGCEGACAGTLTNVAFLL